MPLHSICKDEFSSFFRGYIISSGTPKSTEGNNLRSFLHKGFTDFYLVTSYNFSSVVTKKVSFWILEKISISRKPNKVNNHTSHKPYGTTIAANFWK